LGGFEKTCRWLIEDAKDFPQGRVLADPKRAGLSDAKHIIYYYFDCDGVRC